MVTGLLSAALLSARGGSPGLLAGTLVSLACVAWAIDNHASALIDALSPAETTTWKGLVAGGTNLLLAFAFEGLHVRAALVVGALALGAVSYGFSILLYIVAAQHLGATRAQVAFASAPFLGAGLSLALLGEPLTWLQLATGLGLVASVALLFLGRHEHAHVHEACEHIHSHRHDDGHHDHSHPGLPISKRHTHLHQHSRLEHAHGHLPDLHHRHGHR